MDLGHTRRRARAAARRLWLLRRKVAVGARWYAAAPLRAVLLAVARSGRGAPPAAGEPRRVTFLLSSAWGMGGTIRAVLHLAGHLAAQGDDVQVITAYRRRDAPFFGAFPPGVDVVALDDQRSSAPASARGSAAGRALARIPSVLLHPADRIARTGSLRTDLRLVRLLRARDGVVVGTRPAYNLLVSALGSPRFATLGQEHMHLAAHRPALRRAIRRRYARLDRLGVLTRDDQLAYEALLGGRGRVVQIPNAVAAEFRARSADPAVRTVIAAGRLGRQKGFDLLIPAWSEVAREHPGWRLEIHGAGPQRRELGAQVKRLGLNDSVVLPGATSRLADAMAQASVFALSSRREGFPLILLEAMSTGLAVAAFDCPTGPRDIVVDGVNGLLVPAEDVSALAAALRRLVEDPELRARCAAEAKRTAAGYTIEAIGGRWREVLEDLERARRERRAA